MYNKMYRFSADIFENEYKEITVYDTEKLTDIATGYCSLEMMHKTISCSSFLYAVLCCNSCAARKTVLYTASTSLMLKLNFRPPPLLTFCT
jgi:hypothetical protein